MPCSVKVLEGALNARVRAQKRAAEGPTVHDQYRFGESVMRLDALIESLILPSLTSA